MTPRDLDPLIVNALTRSAGPLMCGEIAAVLHRQLAAQVPDVRARDALCTPANVRDRLTSLRHRGRVVVASRQHETVEGRVVARFTAIRPETGKPVHVVMPTAAKRDGVIAALRELQRSDVLAERHLEACRAAIELLQQPDQVPPVHAKPTARETASAAPVEQPAAHDETARARPGDCEVKREAPDPIRAAVAEAMRRRKALLGEKGAGDAELVPS